MFTTRTVPAVLAAGLLLILTGCAGGAASGSSGTPEPTVASPSASAEGAPSSSASPQASEPPVAPPPVAPPPATGPPALSTLTVSPAGIGTLLMNQPFAAEPAATAMAVWDPTYCVNDARPEGAPGAGAWKAVYPTATVPWVQEPAEAFVMYTQDQGQDAPLSGVFVVSPELSTATGVHPGSTRAELEAAYPEFASVTNRELADIYVVKDPDGIPGELWFEVANSAYGTGAAVTEPIVDTVLWITVHPTSDFAPYSLTETDSGGSPCGP